MIKKCTFAAAVMATALISTACSSSDNSITEVPDNKEGTEVAAPSEKIELTPAELAIVNSGNEFGIKLMAAESKQAAGKGFVMSPISASFLLGMLNEGAQGQTKQEIMQALGYAGTDAAALNTCLYKLLKAAPAVDKAVKLNIANAIYGNKAVKVEFSDSYTKAMKEYYLAAIESLDFNLPSTLQAINAWSNQQTNGMIKEIMTADDFNADALAYILNSIYFKAPWTHAFDTDKTQKATFYTEDGQQKEVDMMNLTKNIGYWANNNLRAISLPYSDGNYRMTVIMPTQNSGKTLADITDLLTDGQWQEIVNNIDGSKRIVNVSLPRFSMDTKTDLITPLRSLGINKAFEDADFTLMLKTEADVHVSKMLQKARIIVSEEGTEAAATSAAEMEVTAMPDNDITFRADHPFIFVISEKTSGAIFFAGQYSGR